MMELLRSGFRPCSRRLYNGSQAADQVGGISVSPRTDRYTGPLADQVGASWWRGCAMDRASGRQHRQSRRPYLRLIPLPRCLVLNRYGDQEMPGKALGLHVVKLRPMHIWASPANGTKANLCRTLLRLRLVITSSSNRTRSST
jgi:hypothetical protein